MTRREESLARRILGEAEEPDLEPFVAFGQAIEMSLLIDRGEHEADRTRGKVTFG
jgi:hypothetical protein